MAKGGEQKDHLTSEDIERCNLAVKDFIDSTDMSKSLVMPDRLMINQCFYHFKTLYKQIEKKKGGLPVAGIQSKPEEQSDSGRQIETTNKINPEQEAEIQRLNLLLKQRDQEMGIMLQYLNKKKEQSANANADLPVQRANGSMQETNASSFPGQSPAKPVKQEESKEQSNTLFQMM